jgi:hypothetical protein
MKIAYICHAYRGDPAGNAELVRQICQELKGECVPLAPHLMLPSYLNDATERDLALRHCLRLVAACDEMRVFGEPTQGMRLEIAEARRLGVPVVVVDDGQERRPPGRDLEAGSGRVRPC